MKRDRTNKAPKRNLGMILGIITMWGSLIVGVIMMYMHAEATETYYRLRDVGSYTGIHAPYLWLTVILGGVLYVASAFAKAWKEYK
jgi:hypothetical protein